MNYVTGGCNLLSIAEIYFWKMKIVEMHTVKYFTVKCIPLGRTLKIKKY